MTLQNKLKIKPEYQINIINSPIGLEKNIGLAKRSPAYYDFILLFTVTAKELQRQAPKAFRDLKDDGILWISYPKLSSKLESDLNRDECWNIMKKFGYSAVSQVSIDDTWSAMRFKPASLVKSKKVESKLVDMVNRVVTIPKDLKVAFSLNKKAAGFFDALSFTHKKEYVLWIESAKKEETRKARVAKTIEMLSKGIKSR
ncbi:MAG: hypothetical protein C0417_13555 [Chlorobiaceae bacterium]|nr:hypothetical protein [Chlorobiaceae bacterium]